MQKITQKSTKSGPSQIWYLVSLLLFILCCIGGSLTLLDGFKKIKAETQNFIHVTPSKNIVNISEPGNYVFYWKKSAAEDIDHGSLTIHTIDNQQTINTTFVPQPKIQRFDAQFPSSGKYQIDLPTTTSYAFLIQPSATVNIIAILIKTLIKAALWFIFGIFISTLLYIAILVKRTNASTKLTDKQSAPIEVFPVSKNEKTERILAMLCHLGSFAGFFLPFANIFVPLIIWKLKRKTYPLVDDQGKESTNFQLSLLIYYLVGTMLLFVIIGFFILTALVIYNFASVIIASVESYRGKKFRYPLTFRFLH